MKTVTTAEVHSSLGKATFLHVLPEEHYQCVHLPGAVNACVYEMVFFEKVAELVKDKAAPIIVYGAGDGSLDASVAAEKLEKAGYSNVSVFSGGLAEWQAQGASRGRQWHLCQS